jgi:hypothetical protein
LRFIVVASYLVDFNAAFREASNQPLQARFALRLGAVAVFAIASHISR